MASRNRASSFQPRASQHNAAPNRKRGGQPGNLNALKNGSHSRQLSAVILGLLADPDARRVLAALPRTAPRQTNRKNTPTANPQTGIFSSFLANESPPAVATTASPRPGSRFPVPGSFAYPEAVTRIILWDVDMTLLYSGGAGSLAFRRAFEQLYGIPDAFSRVEFTGRTDWSIFRSGLEHHGLLDEANGAFERELRRFKERYFSLLERTLAETDGRVMPGVPEALAALSNEDGRARQGLATGNFRRAAFMKLRYFKLDGYLEEGGFGDDAEDRNRLVAIAIERMAAGDDYDPSNVWVIGDTLLDIKAAQSNGAHALAVATGPLSVDELLAQGADVAFEDLSDTDEVLRVLLGA